MSSLVDRIMGHPFVEKFDPFRFSHGSFCMITRSNLSWLIVSPVSRLARGWCVAAGDELADIFVY